MYPIAGFVYTMLGVTLSNIDHIASLLCRIGVCLAPCLVVSVLIRECQASWETVVAMTP